MFRPPALVLLAALVFSSSLLTPARSAQPIPKSDGAVTKTVGIKFPSLPAVPDKTKPPVPVDPQAPVVLTTDVFYVVEDDAPFLLYASPANLVTVTKEAGPIKLRGKFVDGSGKVETREYKSKQIAIIEAMPGADGTVELIASPVGATDEKNAIRRTIQVQSGQGPIPPPNPVDPTVPPVTPVVVKSFRVILVYESMDTLSPSQSSILSGNKVEEFLNASCTDGKAGWKRRDKDATGAYGPDLQGVWDAVKGEFAPPKNTKTPAAVVQVNDKITVVPFEPTPEAMVDLLKKYSKGEVK